MKNNGSPPNLIIFLVYRLHIKELKKVSEMGLSIIFKRFFILLCWGFTSLIIGCILDKSIEPEIPHEIVFQQTALDSLTILMVAADSNGNIYATASRGHGSDLFRSKDKGETWAITLPRYSISSMAFKNNGDIFACTGNPMGAADVLRSSDDGLTWTKLARPGIYPIKIVFSQSGIVFVGDRGGEDVYKGQVYRSTNNGDSWEETGFPDSVGVRSMIINDNGDIFAGTQNGIYRSSDHSNTWELVYKGSSENGRRPVIWYLFINPTNKDIYAASDWAIYRSNDNGDSWIKLGLQLPYSAIRSFVINLKGDIFISVIKFNIPTDMEGVFISNDEGENWKKIDKGIENVIVDHLTIDPFGYLYAGIRDKGVFRTKYSTTE